MAKLSIRADSSEILAYNAPAYLVRTGASCLSAFAGYAAEYHYHPDFEVLIADDAAMDYRVNGECIHLERGEAILVNSGRLHCGFSEQKAECHYRFAVFHPTIFGGAAPVAALLDRLASDASRDWWRFTAKDEEALRCIDRLCDLGAPEDAMAFLSCAAQLMDAAAHRNVISFESDPSWAILRRMIGYIQDNYRERIPLQQIAAAGNVCRSRCCVIFREKLHVSPNIYLTRYRLARACELLHTGISVTEAALSSGFQSASYFSETFRRHYGMTPGEYVAARRKQNSTAEE